MSQSLPTLQAKCNHTAYHIRGHYHAKWASFNHTTPSSAVDASSADASSSRYKLLQLVSTPQVHSSPTAAHIHSPAQLGSLSREPAPFHTRHVSWTQAVLTPAKVNKDYSSASAQLKSTAAPLLHTYTAQHTYTAHNTWGHYRGDLHPYTPSMCCGHELC